MSEVDYDITPKSSLGEMSSIQEGERMDAGGMEMQSGEQETKVIEMIKNDHRKVEQLFKQFESTEDKRQKLEISRKVCNELTVHALLEEELIYPMVKEDDEDTAEEGYLEHESVKYMISELSGVNARDKGLEPKMKVLKELVKHHVEEEEKEMLPELEKEKGEELQSMAQEIMQRKQELMQQVESGGRGSRSRSTKKAASTRKSSSSRSSSGRKSTSSRSSSTKKSSTKKTSSSGGRSSAKSSGKSSGSKSKSSSTKRKPASSASSRASKQRNASKSQSTAKKSTGRSSSKTGRSSGRGKRK